MKSNYNDEILTYKNDYLYLNSFEMDHTLDFIKEDNELTESIQKAIKKQKVIYEEDTIDIKEDRPTTNIILSKKRSLEAASFYKGKKVAVLNFANNHNIGGAPWRASAQEETMCRISTLYPCISACKESFYDKHANLYKNGQIDDYGNDDIIYTPGITVFKNDGDHHFLLDKDDYYQVDMITCAAPQVNRMESVNQEKLEQVLKQRIEKIIKVAKKEEVEVLILGAWGCGAFKNPASVVAKYFKEYLEKYYFETVEIAIYMRPYRPDINYDVFKNVFKK